MLKLLSSVKTVIVSLLLTISLILGDARAADDEGSSPLKADIGEPQWIADLETYIPKLMQAANVPGLSIAVVKDQEIAWSASFGVKSNKSLESINDSTVFQAASLSKTCFAYLVMKLVERGQLDLDTPLPHYLSEDYVENDDRDGLITARMVLSHTTGFPNWRPRDGDLKIYFQPGEKFSYSGEGYGYMQKTVEHITGRSLSALMQQYVLQPLGMRHSSYEWREDYAGNFATGHAEFGPAIDRDPMTEAHAAYSLYTTAQDYAKFMIAMMNHSGLQTSSIREMLTPQIQLDENCLNCTNSTPSTLSKENAWGLGWGLQATDEGMSFWHWGDQGIFRCYTVAFQNQKVGLVYFTNSENGLSIRNEMVRRTLGGYHPAFSWLHYDAYNSASKTFSRLAATQGWDKAQVHFDSLKAESPQSPVFEMQTLNRLGYHFLRIKELTTAIAIFELNVREYPESWNAYDSLAEGYMENGQTDLAIKYYKKSLQLNPDNINGQRQLEKLTEK